MGVGRRLLIAFLSLYQFKKNNNHHHHDINIFIYIYIHIIYINIYIRTVGEVQMHSKYSKNARASWLPCPVHPVHPPPPSQAASPRYTQIHARHCHGPAMLDHLSFCQNALRCYQPNKILQVWCILFCL